MKGIVQENENEIHDDLETNSQHTAEIMAVNGVVEESEDEEYETDQSEERDEVPGKMYLYNTIPTETWRDVNVNPELNEDQKKKLWNLIEEFKEIFSDVPTQTHLMEHKIELTSDEPIQTKPYKLPMHLLKPVQKEVQELLDHGWIEKAENSKYASGIVVVAKKQTKDIRLCVNYKRINAVTVLDPYPMADIDDILARIGSSTWFSTVDMTKGYYAVPLEESCRDYTTFVTPWDAYRFTVLAFGLKNSGAVYAKLLRKILDGSTNIENFVDDVISHNDTYEEHLKTLRDLFSRVRNARIKIKPSKTEFGYKKVKFLGHIIDGKVIRPTTEHIDKIIRAEPPKTKKGIKSLCGAIGFVRKYIPNCAKILKPMTELLVKNKPDRIEWGIKQCQAFEMIKTILTSEPVLVRYDMNKPHEIMSDSSDDSIGGVLLQDENGELHPVMYVSRKLLPRETRYPISQKEALAIVYCIDKFYKFVYGSHFVLKTDCEALSILNGKLSSNARIARWQLYLQSFNFTVKVVKGVDNGLADYCTRMHY